jgi:hypothetical protein
VCVHSSARILPFFLCASGDCSSMQCLKSVTITKMSFHLSSFTGSDNGFHAVDEHKEIRKICRRCARAHDSSCQNNKYPLWNSHSWPLKLQDLYFAIRDWLTARDHQCCNVTFSVPFASQR